MLEPHLVVFDGAGMLENHSRFTCYNPECNYATLIRQPWMNNIIWNQKLEQWRRSHFFHKALSWEEYKSTISTSNN